MLKRRLSQALRRGEAGQSLVIIALGFIGLLAFVGIVTDVSLMFVRFSQLTRAVDSASIAAAGQVRRTTATQDELNETCGAGTSITPENMYQYYDPSDETNCVLQAQYLAFARSFATVGVAARQFIEFYGLSPRQVLVDMCATVSRVNTTTGELEAITPELQDDFEQLCTNDQRKLIRVTAQIESPTVFLRLLGWGNILLQASSISETAVLDVVLVLDVSESLSNKTTYKDWADAGYPWVYVPPSAYGSSGWAAIAPEAATFNPARYGDPSYAQLNFWQDNVQDNGLPTNAGSNAQDEVNAALTTDPGQYNVSPYYVQEIQYPGYPAGTKPREECQVRFFPASIKFDVPSNPSAAQPDPSALRQFYAFIGGRWDGGRKWGGFVPTYNYYGCCNDPNGDLDFSDLICQPFKQARDATERFLHRIDFLRGDRVSFVTFDRKAFIMYVDPDGTAGPNLGTHMIESEGLAITALQRYVGVRAEPSFYEPSAWRAIDTPRDGVMPWQGPSSELGDHDYPVYSSCTFFDALLAFPYSAVSSPPPAYVDLGYTYVPLRYPNALRVGMYPRGPGWSSLTGLTADMSYDLRASCGGGNIGAALRDANDALLRPRTRRTEGAVWVMVMVSDGAAGVSDPVRNGADVVVPIDDYPYTEFGYEVTYGGFGLCPAGSPPGSQGRPDLPDLVDLTNESGSDTQPMVFPFCSDELPETRHFCFDPAAVDSPSDLNILMRTECETVYDVDDYARDWADFVAGIRSLDPDTAATGMTQLPTIFTIGFGFNFDYGSERCERGSILTGPGAGQSDVDDCLGEELLRYIADVGDNFTVDTDYQQWHRNGAALTEDEYGVRGPCEEDVADRASATDYQQLVQPVRAGLSCGNYFNAPDEAQLDDVFDEIASRMFTRLTR